MREDVADLPAIEMPGRAPIRLGVKVAAAAGPVHRILVGDPRIRRFDVIAGPTLDRLAAIAEKVASGEIVADASIGARLPSGIRVVAERSVDRAPAVVVDREPNDVTASASSPVRAPDRDSGPLDLSDADLEGWLPATIRDRLRSGDGSLLAELRPAVSVFVRFGGIDFDAAGAAERLDRFVRWVEDVVAARDGSVIDLTIGEKGSYISIVFGAPTAHVDDTLRAVAVADTLRRPPPEVSLGERPQIGVSRGRVCVGIFGGPTRRTYGLQGIEVSVAARLMQGADPGRVVISERIARDLPVGPTLVPLGPLAVKGLTEPVDAFELVALRSGSGSASVSAGPTRRPDRPATPLLGRRTELGILKSLLGEAAGGDLRAAVVRGEPGLGKSRLIGALGEAATDAGFLVLDGAASALDESSQYSVWRPLFARLLEIGSAGAEHALEAALESVAARDRDRAALLGAVLPVAPPETEASMRLDPAARQDETQRLLVDLFVARRGDAPVLLTIDDGQWLDSASWALLRRLARSSEGLLVVLGVRADPGAAREELESFALVTEPVTVALEPLEAADVRGLVGQALGVETVPDTLARFVGRKADGHPLFTVELSYALRDAGVVVVAGGHARLREGVDLETLAFPESIEGVVTVRVDQLAPDVQDVLKVASVVNAEVSPDLIAAIAEQPALGVATSLDELARLDLLSPGTGSGAFAIRHALIRDAVYGRLLFAQRRVLHRRVAERLETAAESTANAAAGSHAVLAHHWEAAGAPGRALPHLEVAGETAFREGAFPESARLLGRAISLSESADANGGDPPVAIDPIRRAGWEWTAAQASYRLGELDRSRALAESALSAFDRPLPRGMPRTIAAIGRQTVRQLAHRIAPGRFVGRSPEAARDRLRYATRAYFNLAEVYYLASRQDASALAALRGLNLAEKLGPSPELVEAYGAICIIGGLLGRQSIADRYARLGLETAASIDDPFAWAIIRHQVGLYRSGIGPADRVLTDFATAIAGFREIGDKGRIRDSLGLAGIAAYLFGRTDTAEQYFTDVLATHAEGERSLPQTWALIWLGAIELRRGEPARALTILEEAAASGLGAEGLDMTSITLHGLLATAFDRLGRSADARTEAGRARALIDETGGRPVGHPVLDGYAAIGELALADWDRAEIGAEQRAAQAVRSLATYRRVFPIGEPAWHRLAGEVRVRRGDRRGATRRFEAALRAASALDMWPEIARAHAALGRILEPDDPLRAVHQTRAIEVFEMAGMSDPAARGGGQP